MRATVGTVWHAWAGWNPFTGPPCSGRLGVSARGAARLGIVSAMNDAPEGVEEAEASAERVIEITDPDLPDFAPRAQLKRWESECGGAVGFDYAGDHEALLTPTERARRVQAAMDREAG